MRNLIYLNKRTYTINNTPVVIKMQLKICPILFKPFDNFVDNQFMPQFVWKINLRHIFAELLFVRIKEFESLIAVSHSKLVNSFQLFQEKVRIGSHGIYLERFEVACWNAVSVKNNVNRSVLWPFDFHF